MIKAIININKIIKYFGFIIDDLNKNVTNIIIEIAKSKPYTNIV